MSQRHAALLRLWILKSGQSRQTWIRKVLLFRRYGMITTGVIDEEGRLVGIITLDDIIDVIDEEAEEDLMALAEYLMLQSAHPFWRLFRDVHPGCL